MKLAVWNANGCGDIMLTAETHVTSRRFLNIPQYIIYDTQEQLAEEQQ